MQSLAVDIEVKTLAVDEEMNAIATRVNCSQIFFLNYFHAELYFMQSSVVDIEVKIVTADEEMDAMVRG